MFCYARNPLRKYSFLPHTLVYGSATHIDIRCGLLTFHLNQKVGRLPTPDNKKL